MARYSEEFGAEVREELLRRRLSIQEAARRTQGRVSFSTMRGCTLNQVPGAELIVDIAESLGEDPDERAELANRLLRKAGKRLAYVAELETAGRVRRGSRGLATCAAAG